jgi:hypothetical protein
VVLSIYGATVIFDRAVATISTIFSGTGRNETTLEIAGPYLLRIAGAWLDALTKPTERGHGPPPPPVIAFATRFAEEALHAE